MKHVYYIYELSEFCNAKQLALSILRSLDPTVIILAYV